MTKDQLWKWFRSSRSLRCWSSRRGGRCGFGMHFLGPSQNMRSSDSSGYLGLYRLYHNIGTYPWHTVTYLCRDHWSPGQKGPFKIFEVRIALFRFCHCLISSHRWKLWPYASTNQRADSRSQKRPTRRTTWFEACRLGMVNANGRILLYIYIYHVYIYTMNGNCQGISNLFIFISFYIYLWILLIQIDQNIQSKMTHPLATSCASLKKGCG